MAEPFLSEIRIVSFSFPPKGWALCNGQLLPINQNQGLFSLLGTTFGGDGRVNFALPNMQGRVPIHVGNNHTLGERGGETAHTLTVSELPAHSHPMMANSADANDSKVSSHVLSKSYQAAYIPYNAGSMVGLNSMVVGNTGGSQAHLNLQPFLALGFVIALQGIFPSPN